VLKRHDGHRRLARCLHERPAGADDLSVIGLDDVDFAEFTLRR